MSDMYKKAILSRKVEDGIQYEQAWIPEKFAVNGMYLEIEGVNGWHVDSASDPGQEYTYLNERSQDHKKQRVGSDIKRGAAREQWSRK